MDPRPLNQRSILSCLVAVWIAAALVPNHVGAQSESVARRWSEALLSAIRTDFARPTIHARNLFHTSIALYDGWAAHDETATPFLLGRTVGGFLCADDRTSAATGVAAAEQTMSYAAYRLLRHRFRNSPGAISSFARFDALMDSLGFDPDFTSEDVTTGNPAALGNWLGACLIAFGMVDGSNEPGGYVNQYYDRVNPPLAPKLPGNPDIVDPNRWQPLALDLFIDQSGNTIVGPSPPFLSPEWGNVVPFALGGVPSVVHSRDGGDYRIYYDPGVPPQFVQGDAEASRDYRFGFSLVAAWSSHLDPSDGILWDISPGALGNVSELPAEPRAYESFYDRVEGGDPGRGHPVNPRTGRPYEPNLVPRGDYTRVLAEFWADGPDSETPPGHWFTLFNHINDDPRLEKRYRGTGPVLDDLEWDVKGYLVLGGAVHDAAIAAWGLKGWYDYVRPVSAIRFMADNGQSSDPDRGSYSPDGLPLIPEIIDLVEAGDALAGASGERVGKVKLRSWRGPDYIGNTATDAAGVDWILAENWWPYQRPTFVTPPFAGYVSGHSTFSRAAAEVLTLLTGDAFFPGGLGEFLAPRNEFLVFEEGPSVDVRLQWATYRDAADQSGLSRIWGGIHPPADDLPGRRTGRLVGINAFELGDRFFSGNPEATSPGTTTAVAAFPNPVAQGETVNLRWEQSTEGVHIRLVDILGRVVHETEVFGRSFERVPTSTLSPGVYLAELTGDRWVRMARFVVAG